MLEATSVLYHVPLTDQFAEMLQQLIVIFYATNVPLTNSIGHFEDTITFFYQLVIFVLHILSIQGRINDENKITATSQQPTNVKTSEIIEGQYQLFSTKLETTKPVLAYAGCMFDIKADANHLKISTIGFNTYTNKPLDVMLFMKDGRYRDAEYDIDDWMHVVNITVTGQGMGNVTYIPEGSFEPIMIKKKQRAAFYLFSPSGPLLVTSRGDKERVSTIDIPSKDLILYEGVGKRQPIDTGKIFSPRLFNGVIGYNTVVFKPPVPVSGATKPGISDATLEITNSTDEIEVDEMPKINNITEQLQGVKTLYIVRHAEHRNYCNKDKTECEERLRPEGKRRADELANYMKDNDIIDKITHVFASQKPRTYLTVLPIAEMADVNVTTFGTNKKRSVCPTLEALRSIPLNSTIVVAAHGGTVYKILSTGDGVGECDGLGLDTSTNQRIFPKESDGTLPEDGSGFSNLWKVSLYADERVKLDEHVLIGDVICPCK